MPLPYIVHDQCQSVPTVLFLLQMWTKKGRHEMPPLRLCCFLFPHQHGRHQRLIKQGDEPLAFDQEGIVDVIAAA